MASMSNKASRAPLTRAEWADRLLREAILAGELAPGEKLVAGVLAERWDLSPTPVREAFGRLAEAGLVELTPQRGARVAAVSLAEAEEIYELRLILEPLALRRSVAATNERHIAAVELALERVMTASESLGVGDVADAHQDFHATLLSRCPGTWLLKFCVLLAEHSRRYQVNTPAEESYRERLHEHHQLLECLKARDEDGAVKLLERHLHETREMLASAESAALG